MIALLVLVIGSGALTLVGAVGAVLVPVMLRAKGYPDEARRASAGAALLLVAAALGSASLAAGVLFGVVVLALTGVLILVVAAAGNLLMARSAANQAHRVPWVYGVGGLFGLVAIALAAAANQWVVEPWTSVPVVGLLMTLIVGEVCWVGAGGLGLSMVAVALAPYLEGDSLDP